MRAGLPHPALQLVVAQMLSANSFLYVLASANRFDAHGRVVYFSAFASVCLSVAATATVAGHIAASALPAAVALGFLFVNMMFLTCMLAGLREGAIGQRRPWPDRRADLPPSQPRPWPHHRGRARRQPRLFSVPIAAPVMSGDNGALTVILLGAGATFIWRLLGIGLSSRLRSDDAVIQWMTHVAYAVLAALVGRMVIAPTGDMAAVPPTLRVAGLVFGVAVFFICRRSALAGVVAGSALFMGLVSLAGLA